MLEKLISKIAMLVVLAFICAFPHPHSIILTFIASGEGLGLVKGENYGLLKLFYYYYYS